MQESKLSPEEIARRGDEIYNSTLRSKLEGQHDGRIVAIDVESGEHALADSALEASRLLRGVKPNPTTWFIRVGHRALHRIGAGSRKGRK